MYIILKTTKKVVQGSQKTRRIAASIKARVLSSVFCAQGTQPNFAATFFC